MTPGQIPSMSMVPGHSYASFRTYRDMYDRFIIECACASPGCGGHWKKHCVRPELANSQVLQFARIHGHGLRPRVR